MLQIYQTVLQHELKSWPRYLCLPLYSEKTKTLYYSTFMACCIAQVALLITITIPGALARYTLSAAVYSFTVNLYLRIFFTMNLVTDIMACKGLDKWTVIIYKLSHTEFCTWSPKILSFLTYGNNNNKHNCIVITFL